MDDYYKHSMQKKPHYSWFVFTYILDETYTVDHITLYTRDL